MTESRPTPDPHPSQEPSGSYGAPQPKPRFDKPTDGNGPGYGAPSAGMPPNNNPNAAGYGAPSPGMPPMAAPYSDLVGRQLTPDEKTWSMLAHLGGIVLGFLAPLIVMLVKGDESPYTRHNSVEALNFQITLIIAWVVAFILAIITFGIGLILFPVLWIVDILFCVLAGIAANKGETYKYPLTLRLVK